MLITHESAAVTGDIDRLNKRAMKRLQDTLSPIVKQKPQDETWGWCSLAQV
jgi:hypothetical protein